VVTDTIPVKLSPLPTTREERGRQIAQLSGIRSLGARYAVPSQSVRSDAPPSYLSMSSIAKSMEAADQHRRASDSCSASGTPITTTRTETLRIRHRASSRRMLPAQRDPSVVS
jgi:hypothetical protein